MKVTITPINAVEITLDGEKLSGSFKIESEWNGFIAITSDAPCRRLIIRRPAVPHLNVYDFLPRIFGGNRKEGEAPLSVEAEAISHDMDTKRFPIK